MGPSPFGLFELGGARNVSDEREAPCAKQGVGYPMKPTGASPPHPMSGPPRTPRTTTPAPHEQQPPPARRGLPRGAPAGRFWLCGGRSGIGDVLPRAPRGGAKRRAGAGGRRPWGSWTCGGSFDGGVSPCRRCHHRRTGDLHPPLASLSSGPSFRRQPVPPVSSPAEHDHRRCWTCLTSGWSSGRPPAAPCAGWVAWSAQRRGATTAVRLEVHRAA